MNHPLNTAVNTNLTMHAIFLFSLFKVQNLMHSSIKLLIPKIYFMYVWYIYILFQDFHNADPDCPGYIVTAFEMLEMLKNQGAEGAVKIALSWVCVHLITISSLLFSWVLDKENPWVPTRLNT